jgi:hypothetical protein
LGKPAPRHGRFARRFECVVLEDRVTPATIWVTTIGDNGDNVNPTLGSLRAAIVAANSTDETDTIRFASGTQTS